MDLDRIFMKNCCPTKVGGQAILEGLMMRGSRSIAIAIRKPDGNIHLSVAPLKKPGAWKKIPLVRGVVAFVDSLVMGTENLFYGADLLEKWDAEANETEDVKETKGESDKKKEGLSKATIYISAFLSICLTVGLFILLPTFILSLVSKAGLTNVILLNLIEGVIRIIIFILYVWVCTFLEDIRRTFEYHGAEHKTIHCYENGLELTPENAQSFYTLHPRCGTSFMMFVMIISLLVFSLFGWPTLWVRVLSRLVMIPVVAGLSYELLQFTGRHNSVVVKILSLPGIALQKITTRQPSLDELEVAIAAMKAVLPAHEDESIPVDYWVGTILKDGTMVKDEEGTLEFKKMKEDKK
ncbi:MAG: DUF1385 domain-containing protein [Bacillota bacterium]|nr:DUF1385 domain-containing protein [Bacillota bacterium]